MVNQVDGARFRASELPPGRVPVMFTADWCGFCVRFARHFKEMRHGWVVDISDEEDPLWDSFGIRVVPTVVLFEDGVPRGRWAGALTAQHAAEIQAALAA